MVILSQLRLWQWFKGPWGHYIIQLVVGTLNIKPGVHQARAVINALVIDNYSLWSV